MRIAQIIDVYKTRREMKRLLQIHKRIMLNHAGFFL